MLTGNGQILKRITSHMKCFRYLEKSLSKFHPDIIVYNAGTDVLEGDPLGKLAVSAEVRFYLPV